MVSPLLSCDGLSSFELRFAALPFYTESVPHVMIPVRYRGRSRMERKYVWR